MMGQINMLEYKKTKGGKYKRRNKSNKFDGVPVILLDYATGEYIDEYPSMSEAAYDLGVKESTIVASFSKGFNNPCIARIPRYEIMLIRKDAFIKLRESVPR